MTRVVLGIDSSTQSTKVEARDLETGAVLGVGRARHLETHPPISEQDPESWWQALIEAVSSLGDLRRRVVAVAVAGQQHGLVVLDAAGAVVRPAKLWNDTTSAAEAADLVARLGAPWWADACGSVPVAAFTVTKVAWLAAHEPHHHARIRRVMLPHDYLTWRLTGEHVTDRGDASGTGWWSPAGYRDDVLDLVGLSSDLLPRVLGPWEAAGPLSAGAAEVLGLPGGATVGPGTGDNMGAALGLGLASGDVAVSLGTSGTAYAVSDRPTADASGAVAGFADAAGAFLPLVCTLNATRVTDTVAAWLGVDAAELGELALTAGDGSGGDSDDESSPILVPYFDGERTPNRPDSTGLMTGMRTGTSRAELARAAFDGVLCGLLDGVDALTAAGASTGGRIHLVGGGARSRAYRQRLADLVGAPILVPALDEAVATGAAVQAAAVLAGSGAAEVVARWVLGAAEQVDPRPGIDAAARRAQYAAARDLTA